MNVQAQLAQWQAAARRRRAASVLACALPPWAGLLALLARGVRAEIVGIVAVLGLALITFAAWRWARRENPASLARRLDAQAPRLEDSSSLLWLAESGLTPIQRLQRERLQARLQSLTLEVRAPWPRRMLWIGAGSALVLFVLAALWPAMHTLTPPTSTDVASRTAASTQPTDVQLRITPPAYTQLPTRTQAAFDAKVVQDAQLHWSLRLEPPPRSAQLLFHDGSRVQLQREGAWWTGQRVLAASSLYRLQLNDAQEGESDLHRIDVVTDRAPTIRVLAPEQTLSSYDGVQKTWALSFEADDDYGIRRAELSITHAQGSGENVAFKEQRVVLEGQAPDDEAGSHRLRYRHTVDLAALGFAAGDEVIARLLVSDNREPTANTTRSAGLILRWPAPAAQESAGLEGVVQKTMPAYFRSQRQIIIDTQALLAEQAQLAHDAFVARSDAIGVDQKILRLRYGQFLGEESEGHAETAVSSGQAGEASQLGALAAAHEAGERPAHAAGKFGEAGDVVAEYGHVHDIAEAATLLDAQTRATLKSALDAMWQAELHLRQGEPAAALPFEQRALEFIKQVQQATRIYLARVGLELPVPDEKRRLSGERKGLEDRAGSLRAVPDQTASLQRLWQALGTGATPDWQAAAQQLRAPAADAPAVLDVLAALDQAQRKPDCDACRARLRDKLWALLPTPAARVVPRVPPDVAAKAYLDAVQAAPEGER